MIENRQARRKIARGHSRATTAIRLSASHTLLVLLALLALTIQTLVVQPHFHPWRMSGWTQTLSRTSLIAPGDRAGATANQSSLALPDKYPINEDPLNCPLCQEIAHSGPFAQSAAILSVLPLFYSVRFIVFDAALPSLVTVSHIWQGRAPPQR